MTSRPRRSRMATGRMWKPTSRPACVKVTPPSGPRLGTPFVASSCQLQVRAPWRRSTVRNCSARLIPKRIDSRPKLVARAAPSPYRCHAPCPTPREASAIAAVPTCASMPRRIDRERRARCEPPLERRVGARRTERSIDEGPRRCGLPRREQDGESDRRAQEPEGEQEPPSARGTPESVRGVAVVQRLPRRVEPLADEGCRIHHLRLSGFILFGANAPVSAAQIAGNGPFSVPEKGDI